MERRRQLEVQTGVLNDVLDLTQREHNRVLALIDNEQGRGQNGQCNQARNKVRDQATHQRLSRSRKLRSRFLSTLPSLSGGSLLTAGGVAVVVGAVTPDAASAAV